MNKTIPRRSGNMAVPRNINLGGTFWSALKFCAKTRADVVFVPSRQEASLAIWKRRSRENGQFSQYLTSRSFSPPFQPHPTHGTPRWRGEAPLLRDKVS